MAGRRFAHARIGSITTGLFFHATSAAGIVEQGRQPEAIELPSFLLWRAYVPRWSYLPRSGDGAARFGGRWNPTGTPAIYAARELSTAWAEYNQGFVQHPALIAQLELIGAKLADLTNADVLAGFDLAAGIHQCEWRADLDRGAVPATHLVRNRLVEAGYNELIYPSFMSPGGIRVALWDWNRPGQNLPELKVIDPDGRLPVSHASWDRPQ